MLYMDKEYELSRIDPSTPSEKGCLDCAFSPTGLHYDCQLTEYTDTCSRWMHAEGLPEIGQCVDYVWKLKVDPLTQLT